MFFSAVQFACIGNDTDPIFAPLRSVLDLPRELLTLLASERTALSVRRAVENFYIVLQRHNPAAFQTVVTPLYDVLLDSDYSIMIDSVARILASDAEASVTQQQFERMLEKLKQSRTAGRTFVQLVADMICRSPYGAWMQLSDGFRSKQVHASFLELITKQSTETSKFPRSRLVELLRSIAGEKVDLYIDYVIEEALQNPKDGIELLMPLVDHLSEPRNCSEATLKKFFNGFHQLPDCEDAYLPVIKALESRIMANQA
ncbi:hypothetical protein AAVH_09722 [Aphelenchoides avenae]|nr:hypothetical protein AAVH_09722 [Aphelenchus avenae]